MTTRTLTRPVDTTTLASAPAKAHSGLSWLETTASAAYAWLYWPVPFQRGATVVRATLVLHSYQAPAASRTITVRRAGSAVNYSRMTWANQPAGDGATATASSSTSGPAQEWRIDVTALMQEVAAGAFWWGFRLTSSSTVPLRWHSTQSPYESSRPYLEVEWSEEPDAPGDLAPSGGLAVSTPKPVLRWVAGDAGTVDEQSALHVQTSTTANFATVAWDSGVVLSALPELDLADTSFPGFTGTASYWRVRVRNKAMLWSDFSDAAAARYVDRGLVTILEPSGSTLMDSTPVVRWSFSGTQAQYQVVVQRGDQVRTPVWDSGLRKGTDQALTVPSGILRDDKTYTFTVRVWDDVARASVPGAPAYRQASKAVWFDDDLAVPPLTSVSASPRGETPFVDVRVTYTSTPDAVEIVRDHLILARLDPLEHEVEPGVIEWADRSCPPLVEARYKVRAVVNGRRSKPVSTWATSRPVGVWLTTDTQAVCLSGVDQGSPTLGARESVHEVGDRVVVITDALRGHEGDWSGTLHSDLSIARGVTAKEWRDAFMAIRRNPAGARLHMGPVNVPVTLSQMVVRAHPHPELSYEASFTYYQSPGPELDAIDTVG